MPKQYTIVEGDSVTSLADANGFFVQTIWDYPANAALRAKRRSMDILLPGDVITIPDLRVVSVPRPTDQHHRFKRKGVPAIFRLQVFDGDSPRREEDFLLTIGDEAFHGKTDASGVLEHTLPAGTREALLVIGPDRRELLIRFGGLDPESELIGVQKRLNNLGYYCGDPDGTMNDSTREALRAFQLRFSLPQTGVADDATKELLRQNNDEVSRFPIYPPDQDSDPEGGGPDA
jgi:N-acetylmuramoyl-L-alanine amidase